MESTKLARLQSYHDELIEQAKELDLERKIVDLRTLIEGTIGADDPILSSADIARETGWPGVPTSVSMPHDRIRGAYWPFFRTEMELSQIRAIGRILATTTETGISILESLINYTVSEGLQLQWQARDKSNKADPRIARAQQVLDLFLEKNKVIVSKQRELMAEAIPAGEALAILRPCEHSGIPRLQIRSVDHLTEPMDVDALLDYHAGADGLEEGLDWSFGVATPPFQYDDVRGYFCAWYGAGDLWEFLPRDHCIHVKLNVPVDVKRGLSDYYAAYDNIRRARKGFSSSAEGATLQSSIAYIEKFKAGTPRAAVDSQLVSPATYSSSRPGRQGLIPVKVEQLGMGRILRTDRDIMYGPLGAPQGAKLIETFQAVLRLVGTRWNMPEWMISGDASNNNMASSITAGSAFDVSSQARQQFWGDIWVDICLKAMKMMGVDIDELLKLARLTAKGSQIAARDEVQDEQIRDIRNKAGVLSKRTWAQEAGLDYDEEQANIAVEPKPEPPPMLGGAPGEGGGPADGQDATSGEQPPPFSPAARTEGLAFAVAEAAIKEARKKHVKETEDDDVQSEEGDHWVTINGSHVLLSSDGTVKTGRFRGQNIEHLSNEDVQGHTRVTAELDKRATVRTQKVKAELEKPKAPEAPAAPEKPERQHGDRLREKYRELASQVGFVSASVSNPGESHSPAARRDPEHILGGHWDTAWGSEPVHRTMAQQDATRAGYSAVALRDQYKDIIARTPELSQDTRDRLLLLDNESRSSRNGRPDEAPWTQVYNSRTGRWSDVTMRVTDHPGVEGIIHYENAIDDAIGPNSAHYNETEYNAVMDSLDNWKAEARTATRTARQVRLGRATEAEQDEHAEAMAARRHIGDWVENYSGSGKLKFDTPAGKFSVEASMSEDNSGNKHTYVAFYDPSGSTARTETVGEYSHAVFNGVKAGLAAWMFQKKPDTLHFTASGETRAELYDLLCSSATKFGDEPYRAFWTGYPGHKSYWIIKSSYLDKITSGSTAVDRTSLRDALNLLNSGQAHEIGGRVRRQRDPEATGIILDDSGHRIEPGTPEYTAARNARKNRMARAEATADEWHELTHDDVPEDVDRMKFWREFEKRNGLPEPQEREQDTTEAFCPTGEDGGQDNSCPPGNKGEGGTATSPAKSAASDLKSWAQGSKLNDAQGNPLVLWHGTDQPFDKVDMSKGAMGTFWVSSNKAKIEAGESGAAASKHVLPFYVNMKNPAGWDEYDKYSTGELIGMGYDGVMLKDPDGTFDAIVFEPEQVRAAQDVEYHTPRGKIDKAESSALLDAVKANNGFTYQPVDDSTPTKGFVVSHEDGPIVKLDELTPEKIYDWLKENAGKFDADPELHAGGWVHEGEVHLDLVKVLPDEAKATDLGVKMNQYAIWDLKNRKEIEVESERTIEARRRKQQQVEQT